RLRVVDGSLELGAIADHAWVAHERLDLVCIELSDSVWVEPGERLPDAVPLCFDHTPADPAVEDRSCERLQIPGQLAGPGTPGRFARGHGGVSALSLLEHRRERARIEERLDRRDLPLPHGVPLGDGSRLDRDRVQLVDHGYLAAGRQQAATRA